MTTQNPTLERTAQEARRTPPKSEVQSDSLINRLMRPHVRGIIIRQIFLQIFLLLVLATVMFPVLWIISMAVDPRGISRPTDLNLIPENATLDAFTRLLTEPFLNVLPLYFGEMLMNSLFLALGTSVFTVVLGASAAYAFSRFRFIGRQVGMLGFIVLLMLPTTGVLIPLYVLFTQVEVSVAIIHAAPALFNGLFVAAIIYAVFSTIRSYSKVDYERSFNPPPQILLGGVLLLTFVAVILTFVVIYERSDGYNALVETPLKALNTELDEAEDDYNQRVESVDRRVNTADRREERAAAAAADLTLIQDVQSQAQAAADETALASILEETITSREGIEEDPEDDLVLQAALAAQTTLGNDGLEAALTALDEGVAVVEEEALDRQDSAIGARENADEAIASLAESEASFNAIQANYDVEAGKLIENRNNAFFDVFPFMLIAWVAVLIGGGVMWGVTYLLRERIEPRTAINVLAWAIMLAIALGIAFQVYTSRMEGKSISETQSLRRSILGLSLAFASGGLPFAIWNLKGYFDTIPKELEEAARIDGAGRISTFIVIMIPLALPAFAIVILFSFMQGWTEFILSWVFLTGETEDYTLAMALATMAGGSNSPPPDMQKFAAMSILISAPIMILFFAFQRWLVGGLAIGGVKG